MKANHKITSEVYKHIKEKAKELPIFYRTDKSGKVVYTTRTQIKKFEELSDDEKKQVAVQKINTKKQIIVKKQIPVIIYHEVMLIEAFRKKGMQGVDQYINHCINLKKQA